MRDCGSPAHLAPTGLRHLRGNDRSGGPRVLDDSARQSTLHSGRFLAFHPHVGQRGLALPLLPRIAASPSRLPPEDCRVISVTPLLRELILRVTELAALDSRIPPHQRLLNVLLDEMHVAPVTPLMLPLPADARAWSVAHHILNSPSGGETVDQLAHLYGAARRTLERLFSSETGLSFGLWRQKARMLNSPRILAEGKLSHRSFFRGRLYKRQRLHRRLPPDLRLHTPKTLCTTSARWCGLWPVAPVSAGRPRSPRPLNSFDEFGPTVISRPTRFNSRRAASDSSLSSTITSTFRLESPLRTRPASAGESFSPIGLSHFGYRLRGMGGGAAIGSKRIINDPARRAVLAGATLL